MKYFLCPKISSSTVSSLKFSCIFFIMSHVFITLSVSMWLYSSLTSFSYSLEFCLQTFLQLTLSNWNVILIQLRWVESNFKTWYPEAFKSSSNLYVTQRSLFCLINSGFNIWYKNQSFKPNRTIIELTNVNSNRIPNLIFLRV